MFFNLDSKGLEEKAEEIASQIAQNISAKEKIQQARKSPENLFNDPNLENLDRKEKEISSVLRTLRDRLEYIEGELEQKKAEEEAILKDQVFSAIAASTKIDPKDIKRLEAALETTREVIKKIHVATTTAIQGNEYLKAIGYPKHVKEPLETIYGSEWKGILLSKFISLPQRLNASEPLRGPCGILSEQRSFQNQCKDYAEKIGEQFKINVPGPEFSWNSMTEDEIQTLGKQLSGRAKHDPAHINRLIEKQNSTRRADAARSVMPKHKGLRHIIQIGEPKEKAT